MSGPGFKRKGAAQTSRYVASQNVEVLGDNEDDELNLTEGSNPHVKRRILMSSSPPRSPITRSQARPVGLTTKLRAMIACSPNAHDGRANEVLTPISTSMQRTNDTIVGENSTPPEQSGPTPMSGEQGPEPSNKIRSPTRDIGLEKLTKAKGKKLAINVSPSKGRPTDPIESAKLSSEIGLLVRHHLPMNTKFKDITEGVIEESLSRVEWQTYPNPLRFNHAYSVVKQYFVDVDDTVPQKKGQLYRRKWIMFMDLDGTISLFRGQSISRNRSVVQ